MGALGGGGDAGASDGGDTAGGNKDGDAVCVKGAGGGGGVGVRLEGSGTDGVADSTGEGSMAGISRAANAARAGDDATRSGDSPSVGGIGMSGGGEAGTPSHSDGGVEGGGTDVIVRVVGDVVAC